MFNVIIQLDPPSIYNQWIVVMTIFDAGIFQTKLNIEYSLMRISMEMWKKTTQNKTKAPCQPCTSLDTNRKLFMCWNRTGRSGLRSPLSYKNRQGNLVSGSSSSKLLHTVCGKLFFFLKHYTHVILLFGEKAVYCCHKIWTLVIGSWPGG